MNVKYTDINCQDAARSIGVSAATIQGWCRGNLINFVDIGDGNKKPRYMISEQEVNYLKSLVKSHGKRKALLFYNKDYNVKGEPEMEMCDTPVVEIEEVTPKKRLQFNVDILPEDKKIVDDTCTKLGITKADYVHNLINKSSVEPVKAEDDIPIRKIFKKDEIVTTISYIQDIKERLEDIEAERNQLLNELADLKSEVMSMM